MAKRIGKYKISNKETALSIADGGVVNGAITAANEDGNAWQGATFFGPGNRTVTMKR